MKKLTLLTLLMLSNCSLTWGKDNGAAQAPKKILMIINEGFWAPEYYEPRAIFDHSGYQVTVASERLGLTNPDHRNSDFLPVKAEVTFDKVDVTKYDAVTFAGGNGAWTSYFPNPDAHKILVDALNSKKIVAALLCSATGLLAVANNFDGRTPIAKGRHVTGYFRVMGLLQAMGQVDYDGGDMHKPYVVVDGNLITGRDPSSAKMFGEAIRKKLLEQK